MSLNTGRVPADANIVLAKRFFEDRTQSDLERFLSFVAADAKVDFSELDRPYGRIYNGHGEIARLFGEMTAPWQEIQFKTRYILANDENIVLDVERTARSHATSFGVSSTLTARLVVRAGKIIYFRLFQHRLDALRAAGLSD